MTVPLPPTISKLFPEQQLRWDPYWNHDLWTGGGPIWRRRRVNYTEMSARLAHSEKVRRVVAWLAAYRCMSSVQLSFATGVPTSRLSTQVLGPMMDAWLVERGRSQMWTAGSLPYLYRLVPGPHLDRWLASLDPDDFLAVVGDTAMPAPHRHDRHDHLAAEFAVRAWEHLPGIQAVLGEPFAAHRRLVPWADTHARGDTVVVTGSGVRIVVEVTCSATMDLPRKVASWGRLLGERPLNESGVVVVFLCAAAPARNTSIVRLVRRYLDTALTDRALGRGGSWVSPVAVRRARSLVFVADWRVWFPKGETTSAVFETLTAADADGNETQLLTLPFSPARPEVWSGRRAAYTALYSVPPGA